MNAVPENVAVSIPYIGMEAFSGCDYGSRCSCCSHCVSIPYIGMEGSKTALNVANAELYQSLI